MRRGLFLAAAAAALAGAPALAQHEMTTKPDHGTALLDELPAFEKPAVWFGSPAPGMHIAKWVKGDPVTEFESGQIYVVEFWATWCGPCRKAFPLMTELQKTYGDQVRFVGVNIWDRPEDKESGEYTESMDDCTARIASFVKERSDDMGYTVAIEDSGKMAGAWMKAAGQNGIPAAFIVDGSGRVAWIGSPFELDDPLAQVVKGSFDIKSAAKKSAEKIRNNQWLKHVMKEIAEGDSEKGYRMAGALVDGPLADDAQTLNWIAWDTLTSRGFEHRNPAFSIKAATRACELTDWKDAAILDTLARGYYDNGELEKAIKTQRRAVANAEGDMKAELEKVLEEYLSE